VCAHKDPLPIEPLDPSSSFDARITPPGSKSITNRALLLAALASGESRLHGALTDANDAKVMLRALTQMGVAVKQTGETVTIQGADGKLRGETELHLGNAGTATRFLTAACTLADGPVTIDGDPRMRERPIGELLGFLHQIGARLEALEKLGFPPIRVEGGQQVPGGEITVPTTLSSQYVSALLMLGSHTLDGITLRFSGEVTSRPYIEMTIELMRRTIGCRCEGTLDARTIRVPPMETVPAFELDVEPDASGATYFFASAALFPGASVTVPIATATSLQSDARFVDLLARMGADIQHHAHETTVTGTSTLRGINADLSDMPDAAMTLATVACFAEGETTITGLRTLRVKETDRLRALVNELSKIGAGVEIVKQGEDEGLRITPPASMGEEPIIFETYDDHRMAMALALIGLRRRGVSIADPTCVGKTYPGYWADLEQLRQ
jgi:3-phosphoshikimate 1-carboxyvinyltransferase